MLRLWSADAEEGGGAGQLWRGRPAQVLLRRSGLRRPVDPTSLEAFHLQSTPFLNIAVSFSETD